MAKTNITRKCEEKVREMNRLREFRVRAGYKSAKQFAEMVGYNVRSYQAYESGETSMGSGVAWLFADLLGCTVDQIIGRDRG